MLLADDETTGNTREQLTELESGDRNCRVGATRYRPIQFEDPEFPHGNAAFNEATCLRHCGGWQCSLQINPEVKIIRTEQSKVDWRAVIGVGGFDLDRVLAFEPEFLTDLDAEHQHDDSISSDNSNNNSSSSNNNNKNKNKNKNQNTNDSDDNDDSDNDE